MLDTWGLSHCSSPGGPSNTGSLFAPLAAQATMSRHKTHTMPALTSAQKALNQSSHVGRPIHTLDARPTFKRHPHCGQSSAKSASLRSFVASLTMLTMTPVTLNLVSLRAPAQQAQCRSTRHACGTSACTRREAPAGGLRNPKDTREQPRAPLRSLARMLN
jgi:hypothetical protein